MFPSLMFRKFIVFFFYSWLYIFLFIFFVILKLNQKVKEKQILTIDENGVASLKNETKFAKFK